LRIGSAPTVWGIDLCPKETGTYVVYVTFSESVADLNAVDVPAITVQVGGRPCTAMGGANPAPNTRRGFLCTQATDSDVFTIGVDDGLMSPEGIAVAPGTFSASPATLGVAASGCQTYKVAL
jgi:hypothetical protein